MDVEPRQLVLPGLVALILLNQVVSRVPFFTRMPVTGWAVNVLNVIVGGYAVFAGLPGFEKVPAANWIVMLALLMHTAKNVAAETDRKVTEKEQRRYDEALAERERLRAQEEPDETP